MELIQDKKDSKKIAYFAISLVVLWEIAMIFTPISGGHAWRQSDTAAVARNFYLESPNIFYPRIDWRGHLTGITGMEFPLYQYLVSLLYYIVPTSFDFPGKIVSFSCALLLVYEYYSYKKIFPFYVIFISFFLIQEFFLLSSRFMPDLMALYLAFKGYTFYKKNTYRASLIFYTMGVLVRPYSIFWCTPILIDFLKSSRDRNYRFLLGAGILVLPAIWYLFWNKYLVEEFGIDYFYTGSGDFFLNLFSIDNWSAIFVAIFENYTNPILIFVFLISFYKFKSSYLDESYVFFSALLGIVFLTGSHVSPHSYYLIAIIPVIGAFFTQVIVDYKLVSVFSIFLIFTVFANLYQFLPYQKIKDEFSLVEDKHQNSLHELVIMEGNNPVALNTMRARGWSLNRSEIWNPDVLIKLKNLDAVKVYPIIGKKYHEFQIDQWFSVIEKDFENH